MSTADAAQIRAMPEEDILRIARGLPYRTSGRLNWSGVEVHRYACPALESPEHSFPKLVVFLSHVSNPINGEVRFAGVKLKARLGNNTVSVAPPGLPYASRCDGPSEVTAIFLDPITEFGAAGTDIDRPEIVPQYAIRDSLIRQIGTALDSEMMSPRPGPRIYAESLATALTVHISAKYGNPVFRSPGGLTLARTQLRRSVEFINDYFDRDLTLKEIAAAANMSKYHFAKAFRQLMGIAPHQYLVKLRIEKARKLLAIDTMSVEEIASRVGYSDKGHFVAQFRRLVGVSPHRYRLDR